MPPEPILYLSLFFKKHRRLYYDRLNGTRENENWTAWMDFFLQGAGYGKSSGANRQQPRQALPDG
jgi:Fic family protein